MNKAVSLILAFLLISMIFSVFGLRTEMRALAASADHPVQLMNIVSKDASKALKENGTADGSALSAAETGSDLSSSWRLDRVNTDANGTFFKIVNAQSGRLLTPQNYNVSSGAKLIVYGSESEKSQHWYVIPVSTDRLGNSLYYKIVNYSDTSLALTQSSSGISLSAYTGADSQLWLLNCDGLQGFAGYCSDDTTGKVKAGNIGGLFGETVEAATFDELKKYATSDEPYTIIVTNNISVSELNMNGERYMCSAGRIYVHNNKTIIGSYNAHTLFNVQFCTSSKIGTGNNIIIKNFDMQHDAESNNNDSIVCYFGSGENIWVDHVTFTGHNNYGYAPKTGKVDEDKFLACCYDADYCTVSDCSFGAHKYGLILGYPADGANEKAKYDNFPRMSLISNKFNDTNTRGPGLMRWGYYHSLNNYVNKFSMAYTVISNCKIYAENCTYENGGNVICDWDKMTYTGSYSESGSVFSNCKRTKQGGDSNSTATACSWRPASNYKYTALSAADAKNYCNSYSGCQKDKGNMMYLRYSSKGVPSAGYTEAPSAPVEAEPKDGTLVRSLKVSDAANSSAWNISDNTRTGDVIYGDRDFIFTDIPEMLNGSEHIITACDSKMLDSDLAAFTVSDNVIVYVAIDKRVTNIPAWLTAYRNTEQTITASNDVAYSIYALEAEQGSEIVLGTNGQSAGCVNYTAFVQKQPQKVIGDINADGEFSVADLVLLQKWLLAVPDTTLADRKAGDLCEDGILDVFDLVKMRQELSK